MADRAKLVGKADPALLVALLEDLSNEGLIPIGARIRSDRIVTVSAPARCRQ